MASGFGTGNFDSAFGNGSVAQKWIQLNGAAYGVPHVLQVGGVGGVVGVVGGRVPSDCPASTVKIGLATGKQRAAPVRGRAWLNRLSLVSRQLQRGAWRSRDCAALARKMGLSVLTPALFPPPPHVWPARRRGWQRVHVRLAAVHAR